MKKLILASGSQYRKALLERLHLSFEVVLPTVNEDHLKASASHLSPPELAQHLAKAKALSIAKLYPEAIVIGSDQLVSFQNEVLGKPHTEAKAIQQLERMQGQTHELITATCVAHSSQVLEDCNITKLTLRHLNREQIERYVQLDQPLDCAGSNKFEKLGIALVERIEMSDETAIQGLPLIFICSALSQLGFQIP